jgi:hypothetical protein
VESHTAVIIPFNDRVFFASLLSSAELSSWLSEVAKTLDAISGIKFLTGRSGLREWWLVGAVCVRRRSSAGQNCTVVTMSLVLTIFAIRCHRPNIVRIAHVSSSQSERF